MPKGIPIGTRVLLLLFLVATTAKKIKEHATNK